MFCCASQFYYFGEAAGGDPTLREQLRGSPHFDACEEFCLLYDQAAFDSEYESLPLEFFVPMVERTLRKPAYHHPEHEADLVSQLKVGIAAGYPADS